MNPLRRALRGSLTPAHFVFAGVLLVRLVTLLRATGSPGFIASGGDAHFYDDWAQRIAAGEWTDHHAFYGLPLYAYALGAIYKIFGHAQFVIELLQIFADAGTATLLFKIASAVFADQRAPKHLIGILAAAGWAFFVPAEVYSVVLMPTAWVVFCAWLVVWRVIKDEHAPGLLRAAFFGLFLGCAAMAVATILCFAALIVAAIVLKPSASGRSLAIRAKAFPLCSLVAGIVIGASPAWLHNSFVARDPVFLSAHSGVNFWIGNNAEATGYPHFPDGLSANQSEMLRDSIAIAEHAAGHPLRRSDVSRYWSAKAWTYIKANPSDWMKLLGVKLRNFWSAFEYDDLSVISRFREEALVIPGLSFGIVAALALPGICFGWRRFPKSGWVLGAVALQLAAMLPVFVTERYRLGAAPGLILFAAAGLWLLWRYCAELRIGRVAAYLGLAALAALGVSAPPTEQSVWALQFYNAGLRAAERGDGERAEDQFRAALAYAPGNPEVTFALANLYYDRQELERAQGLYEQVLATSPGHRRALNNLGVLNLDTGRFDVAERYLRASLEADGSDAKIHYLLARVLATRGDRAQARIEADRAVELRPQQPEFVALRDSLIDR